MNRVIHCPCGYVVRADTEEDLVVRAQEHAKEAHDMELTPEQAIPMPRPE